MAGEFHITGFAAQREAADGGPEVASPMAGHTGYFVSNIPAGVPIGVDGGLLYIPRRGFIIGDDGAFYERLPDGSTSDTAGLNLTADDPAFELERPLQWQYVPDEFAIGGDLIELLPFWFDAREPGWTGSLDELTPVPGVEQPGGTRGLRGFTPWFEPIADTDPALFQAHDPNGPVGPQIQLHLKYDPRGPIDLSDRYPAIKMGRWQATLGAEYATGQTWLKNNVTPFTTADIGKVVIVHEPHVGPEFTRFMATILNVGTDGTAELDAAAPTSATNERVYWGADITDALNDALAEIAADATGPREAYLPGAYRATQVVIPSLLTLRGAGWGSYSTDGIGDWTQIQGSFLKQLPGAEKDFVVFNELASIGGQKWLGPVGLTGITLEGPETNVIGHTPSVGSGLAMRNPAGDALVAQDGCQFDWVQAIRFPGNGFDIPAGAVPLTLSNCRAFYNNLYGFDYNAAFTSNTQMLHLLNPTADGNTLGMARFRNAGPYGPIAITSAKSEAVSDSMKLITPLGNDLQMAGFIFQECDRTPVVINGMSHIYGGSAKGPGPAVVFRSTTTKRPRIAFDCIAVRVTGAEAGSVADAVTLRDEVSGVDIPHTIVSGIYPESNVFATGTHEIINNAQLVLDKGANAAAYNTVDQATNYEKVLLRWLSNALELASLYGGTGTAPRDIHIGVANSAGSNTIDRRIQVARDIPFVSVRWNGTGNAGQIVNIGDTTGFTGSSGVQVGLGIDPVVNQTGAAGFSMLLINPTETGTGSGAKNLIQGQVGSVDKFTVDHSGNVVAAGGLKAGSTFDVITQSVLSLTTSATLAAVDGREYTYLLGSGAVPTLPTAVGNKCVYHLKNVHTAGIVLATTSSQTIDGGVAPITILPGECYSLVSDQSNWWIR